VIDRAVTQEKGPLIYSLLEALLFRAVKCSYRTWEWRR